MKFWKLLMGNRFTGSPSKLTEDEVRQMGNPVGLFEPEIEAASRGCGSLWKKRNDLLQRKSEKFREIIISTVQNCKREYHK
jgi:hypothetical protein